MFIEVKRKGHIHEGKIFELGERNRDIYDRTVYNQFNGLKAGFITPVYVMTSTGDGDVVRYDPYFYKEHKFKRFS